MKKFNFHHWYVTHLGNREKNYYYKVYGFIFLILNLIWVFLVGSLKGHTPPNWFIDFCIITGIFGGIYFGYILTEKICSNMLGSEYPKKVTFYFFFLFLFSYLFSILILYLLFVLFWNPR
jgi:hypothetical protein